MENRNKKTVALLLSFSLMICLLAALMPVRGAEAVPPDGCAVIGEDLTNAQTRAVYELFGFPRGSVPELPMSSEEERRMLSGAVPEELIDTAACTCVYLRLLPEGSGIRVTADGVTWCTPETYRAALETAGITDVEMAVAAPVPVSGVSALPAAFMAWESLTGQTIHEDARRAGLQELITAAELAGEMGESDAVSLTERIRTALSRTSEMSDQELDAKIRELAAERGVKLNDTQVQMLMDLCRRAEKLSDIPVTEKIDEIKDSVEKIEEFSEKTEEIKDSVASFGEKVKHFFASARDFLAGLFGKN